MDSLTAVKDIKELAQNAKHRQSVVNDKASVDSLLLFLEHSDPMVVQETLLTFVHLTQTLDDRKTLRGYPGIISTLRALSESQNDNHDSEIRRLAGDVYRRLDMGGGLDLRETGVIRKGRGLSKVSSLAVSIPDSSSGTASPFIRKSKNSRSVTFYIEGLHDQESKAMVEETLCSIIGVISFTFNLTKQRTVIRVRPEVGAATIAQALSRAGFPSPQQVVKNPKGQEEYISFECSRPNSPLPDYLPEEDPEVEDPTTAVRLQGQPTEMEPTWLSATVNYLARSMYW
ncbi:armadillo repeat-containing protein 1-like isoform X2 [Convolutriloba macropyga]|uniref:armadillo repeat-containing protein 1-like isoform X2 n=1 Tax=Convolutriloba macropyga TaxID=536237 RepID=UPI003F526BBA